MSTNEYTTLPSKRTKNLIGLTFGALRVIAFGGYRPMKSGKNHASWICQCICGTQKVFLADNLLSSGTQSCGCVKDEKTRVRNTTHGKSNTVEYTIWCAMIQRCFYHKNDSFKNYGERGISICEEWRSSFATFLADMGQRPSSRHSLERLNNECGYSPENCIWATAKEQQRNKRTNRLITYNDETLCLAEWQERTGLPQGRIYDRLTRGWPIEKALFTPVRHPKPRER